MLFDERDRIGLRLHALVVVVERDDAGVSALSDLPREGALAHLPRAVDHHDAGAGKRLFHCDRGVPGNETVRVEIMAILAVLRPIARRF